MLFDIPLFLGRGILGGNGLVGAGIGLGIALVVFLVKGSDKKGDR
jgi:hypothetical protein